MGGILILRDKAVHLQLDMRIENVLRPVAEAQSAPHDCTFSAP